MRSISVFLVAAQLLLAASSESNFLCKNISEEICECISNCPFSTLDSAMNTDENQYKLWTAFHHPREALPQWLVVSYSTDSLPINEDAIKCNNTGTYLWTSNSIYFVVPPQVFGVLTLFLGVLDDDHTGSVALTIPDNCSCWLQVEYLIENDDATLNYLEVLTERVCDIACNREATLVARRSSLEAFNWYDVDALL